MIKIDVLISDALVWVSAHNWSRVHYIFAQEINMLALLILHTVHFLSVHAQFLNGHLYISTRNVSYVPGDEIDDFPLDGGKAETWCAYRCLEASSCLMVDVCHFSRSTRCRLWRALPAQDFAGITICRRFSAVRMKFDQTRSNSMLV